MELKHRALPKVDILHVIGRVDASTAPELQQALQELFAEGRYRIVLDLSELSYVSSPGRPAR